MTSIIDIYRTAKHPSLNSMAPEDALLMAAKRADALLGLGDVAGRGFGGVY